MGEPTSIEARRTWNTVIALVGIALLACVSSTIEGRGSGGAYAPANEQRGGSLRYYEGTKSRDDAYREMFTYCGGPYEIAAERDVNRGMTTNYSRYNTTTTASIEHVIDFRCVEQTPRTSSTVRLSGDEWRLARDWVIQNSGCPQANVEHEVASPTPGAKGYAVSACGQRWLCSAGNGMAVCGVDGSPAPALGEGEKSVTKQQFLSRLKLQSIAIDEGGRFTFWFGDGDLFWGHSIEVYGSLEGGLEDASLAG